jgi:hypothetical protein
VSPLRGSITTSHAGAVVRPWFADADPRTLAGVTVHRYRLSTTELAEALLRLLDLDDAFHASRPIGYAYTRVVDIEHPDDVTPDVLVRALDPHARLEHEWPEP